MTFLDFFFYHVECNSLYIDINQSLLVCLQLVQNIAAVVAQLRKINSLYHFTGSWSIIGFSLKCIYLYKLLMECSHDIYSCFQLFKDI